MSIKLKSFLIISTNLENIAPFSAALICDYILLTDQLLSSIQIYKNN